MSWSGSGASVEADVFIDPETTAGIGRAPTAPIARADRSWIPIGDARESLVVASPEQDQASRIPRRPSGQQTPAMQAIQKSPPVP
jgi:hypothetical protein